MTSGPICPFVRLPIGSPVLLSGCHHQFRTLASVITLSVLLLLPINNFEQRQETSFRKQLITCVTFRDLSLRCQKSLYKINVLLANVAFRQLRNQQPLQNLRNKEIKNSEAFSLYRRQNLTFKYCVKYIVRFSESCNQQCPSVVPCCRTRVSSSGFQGPLLVLGSSAGDRQEACGFLKFGKRLKDCVSINKKI